MSGANLAARSLRAQAPVFAALGDETRLSLVARLGGGSAQSITQLTAKSRLTRQAITKHLRMIEDAGLVHSAQAGRESVWQLESKRLEYAQRYLREISTEWDQALIRLKRFVERP